MALSQPTSAATYEGDGSHDPTVDLVAHLLAEHYGISGSITAIAGEIDRNFHVIAEDGRAFMLRIHADGTPAAEIDLQAAALRRLADIDLPVQRLVPSITGADVPFVALPDGSMRHVRVTTWLPGDVWATAIGHGRSARAVSGASLGRLLAHLDLALRDFDHPAADRSHRWDLAVAADHRSLADLVEPTDKRDAVRSVLQRFAAEIAPMMHDQPRQIVHNDANDRNVLLADDGTVSGLIDFGDTVRTWRVNELAIACTYAMIGADDPIGAVVPLIAAYHDENLLTEIEADVLFDLVCTRCAVSICMAAKQIRDEPGNDYLLISQHDIWLQLQRLLRENRRIAVMRIRAACRYEPVPNRRAVERWLERNSHAFSPVLRRDMSRAALTVLDLTAGSPDGSRMDALYDDEALATSVPVGRFGEDRSIYDAPEFETADPTERRTIHVGIDLFAPAGDEVVAPLDGVVAEIGCDLTPLGFGGILLLEHTASTDPTNTDPTNTDPTNTDPPSTDTAGPDDVNSARFWTLYGHLSSASMAQLVVGQAVRAGETVARLGRNDENGNWPPHLHFQLMTDRCDWTAEEIVGVVARSQWDVWSAVFLDPNLVLGLPVNCSVVVARDTQALRRERRHVLGRSLSIAYHEPLKIVRGEGVHLIDDRGRRYLDMVNNVCHVGHCHPRVVEAGERQMRLLNTNTRYLHDNIIEYSRRLTDTLPGRLSVTFMVNSGSEANDLALRLARAATGQRDAITVDHVYHGNVTSIVDVSPYKFDGPGGEGRRDHVWVAEMPDLYRGRWRAGSPDAGTRYAGSVAEQIAAMGRVGRRPAVFYSEAILGTGGLMPLPDGYMRAAYEHVHAAGGVCVADEVQLGFGRVGSHMWAFETQGAQPDIVTMGKPIGNGHPIGAVVTTPEIADAFANGMEYFNTFGGNPVSAAIGLAVLDVVRDEHLMHNAAVVGERMTAGLRELARRHTLIGDVRGIGLFIGVEMVRDHDTLEPATAELREIVEAMKADGVLLSTDGPYDNVLKIKPPLVFSADDCDEFLGKLDRALARNPARTDH